MRYETDGKIGGVPNSVLRAPHQAWMDLPKDREMIKRIERLAHRTKKFDTLLVLGIGGSDLGTRTIIQALPTKKRVLFAGSTTDPDEVARVMKEVNWKKTLVNVVSKSGETVEIAAVFSIVRQKLEQTIGKTFAHHIVATTDPDMGSLEAQARREGYHRLFIPKSVGGRFSVLSDVALFPAAWAGIDIRELLKGALEKSVPTLAASYARIHKKAYDIGRDIWVLMPYSHRLQIFALWYRQLIAESLGKDGKGPTPVAALGPTDQHSQLQLYMQGPQNKVVTFIEIEKFETTLTIPAFPGRSFQDLIHAQRKATSEALTTNNRPNGTIFVPKLDARSLGSLFQFFMLATAHLGQLFKVNTYDQPGVEEGKKRVREWLANKKKKVVR